MIYSKEEFKEEWESSSNCSITFNDIADCAKDWGLYSNPKCYPIHKVGNNVLKAAGCEPYFEED